MNLRGIILSSFSVNDLISYLINMQAFLKNLIVCSVAIIRASHASLCFDGSKLPKVLAGKSFNNNSQYSAIVGDASSLYLGGMTGD